jgi:hypothetical protein
VNSALQAAVASAAGEHDPAAAGCAGDRRERDRSLELEAVEQLLARAGVDLGDLVEIKGKDDATHRIGAA